MLLIIKKFLTKLSKLPYFEKNHKNSSGHPQPSIFSAAQIFSTCSVSAFWLDENNINLC